MIVGPKIHGLSALAANLLIGIASAQDRGQEPDPKRITDVKPNGQPQLVAWSQAGKTGTYWVRIPQKAKKELATRAILWLHGARGSGHEHQQALATAGLGKQEILICPNGAHKNGPFSYDHDRDAANLLLALDDVAACWKLGSVFLGGHSQGAFTTHIVFAAAPERFAGVLPCSGGPGGMTTPKGMLDKAGKTAAPIFLVHGDSDPTVDSALDDKFYETLLEGPWTALRYLHPFDLDHDLGKIPLKECFEWLFALGSDKPAELLTFAKQAANSDRPRDALYALDRAEALKAPASQVQALRKTALARTAVIGKEWVKRLETEKTRNEALGKFYDARSGFFGTEEGEPAFAAFRALRDAQAEGAKQAVEEARAAARDGKGAARGSYEALLGKYPAVYAVVREAQGWLAKNRGK